MCEIITLKNEIYIVIIKNNKQYYQTLLQGALIVESHTFILQVEALT